MWKDEIVDQTRKAREEYAAKFNYDLAAIYDDLKQKEAATKHRVVSLSPKEPNEFRRHKVS